MSATVGHVIAGVAFSTLIVTVFVAVVKFTASVGVNVTDSVWFAPAFSTLLEAGEYTKLPGTLAVALSCVALRAVPYAMSAGVDHVIVTADLLTLIVVVAVAVV